MTQKFKNCSAQQYEHLLECAPCRMVMSTYDFHAISIQHQKMAIDYMTRSIMDGHQSMLDGTHKWNNVPFTDTENRIDPKGGFTLAPGKGSHSFVPAGNGQVKMRPNGGSRNSLVFTLMIFITPINAARGEFHFQFCSMYDDAHSYLKCFSGNGGSYDVRHYWDLMSRSILRLLRTYPTNIVPAEALNPCERKINAGLVRDGKLKFCDQCVDFHACTVNKMICDTLKD